MTRVDNEIAHGKKLASEGAEEIWNWSSPAGQKRADRRANYFVELAKVKPADKVLEIGCGTALFTRKFYDATKADIIATDISDDLLNEARKNLPQVTFKNDDAMKMSFASETFDVVFGSSILHHLDFNLALKEIYRVLKPGGKMIFAEPNMLNPQIFIQKNVPFIKKWLGDSPDETAVVRWSFKSKMEKIGFRSVRIFPYDFLHPSTPEFLIPVVKGIGNVVEKIPLLNEIAGSVIIYGEK
jgi:ubiquinone/menaquinone biosynthesis C-methylase UbiE